jgi:hypothetical protein
MDLKRALCVVARRVRERLFRAIEPMLVRTLFRDAEPRTLDVVARLRRMGGL